MILARDDCTELDKALIEVAHLITETVHLDDVDDDWSELDACIPALLDVF